MDNGKLAKTMVEFVSIDLSNNYDLRVSVDFEYDQALFTIGMSESSKD